uniref:16S rRNA (Guanine(966)-N(2))-methyltransferase RsmD n=1 Tax=candidate division WOR-3 bacterium TaxID=2052148 RepID=A0A7C3YS90_UNCW3
MFITGGELKGKRLKYPKGKIRPTERMVKLAIFSALGEKVKGSRVLDLFSGPGAMGIEALSRGAQEVYFVESDKRNFSCLLENIKGLKGCQPIRRDVFKALPSLKGEKFDLIFLDPPYCQGIVERVIENIVRLDLLTDEGIIVAEHHKKEEMKLPLALKIAKNKVYGETEITFLKKERK